MQSQIVWIQVGLELEMISKDERDLTQSRAELEALLTQQRSAEAARVQSPPSTSTSTPQDSNQVSIMLHVTLLSLISLSALLRF